MYVQEDRLETLFDLPVQLPQVMIPAAGWLAIATIQLPEGATLDLRWLQLYVAATENSNSADPCGTAGQNIINPNYLPGSLVSLFLIKDWAPNAEPWTQTILDQLIVPTDFTLAAAAVPPVIAIRSLTTPLDISDPGIYTFVVLNNTTNRNLAVTVDGAVTVDADAILTVPPTEPPPPVPPVPGGGAIILIADVAEIGTLTYATSFGGTQTQQYTISNIGTTDLVVTAVSYEDISPAVIGDDGAYPITIAPNNSVTINAELTPNDSSGDPLDVTGHLSVTSNAISGDNTYPIAATDIWVS